MKTLAPALLAFALCLVGCHKDNKTNTTTTTTTSNKKASMGMVNSKCPISGEPVKAGGPTAEYNGQTVGFCCKGCAGKFSKLSDADKAAKVSAAK